MSVQQTWHVHSKVILRVSGGAMVLMALVCALCIFASEDKKSVLESDSALSKMNAHFNEFSASQQSRFRAAIKHSGIGNSAERKVKLSGLLLNAAKTRNRQVSADHGA